jgi:hypothetical protein
MILLEGKKEIRCKDYAGAEKDTKRLREVTVETEALGIRLAKEIQQLRSKAKSWERECSRLTLLLDRSLNEVNLIQKMRLNLPIKRGILNQ